MQVSENPWLQLVTSVNSCDILLRVRPETSKNFVSSLSPNSKCQNMILLVPYALMYYMSRAQEVFQGDNFVFNFEYVDTVPLNLIKGPSKGSKKPPDLKIVWNQPQIDGVLHYILETAYFKFMNSYVGDTFHIKSLT